MKTAFQWADTASWVAEQLSRKTQRPNLEPKRFHEFSAAVPGARHTDPITSHEAAAKAVKFAGSHAERILEAIRRAPRNTPEYYSAMTGLTVVQIDRRLVEMKRKNLIRVVQQDGQDLTYHGFRVWEAVQP